MANSDEQLLPRLHAQFDEVQRALEPGEHEA
jgi:hypothetical protein